ncbi:MAG TPA: DUF4112 domain-containing protein [Terracidiphilus sp.]|nr:DUF4112 domain-containing protein [Terracidiphilus sp.]
MPQFPPPPGPPKTPSDAVPAPQHGRWQRGAWLFRDDTLRSLEFLLDECFRVPGTRFRFGVDGIVGLVPVAGDVLTGLVSLVIPLAGWTRGVPYVALVRMTVNVAIGVLVGSIPLFGDLFDIIWKANRRNLRLLHRHLSEPRRHSWRDWVFLLLLVCALGVVFALPIVLLVWIVRWLLQV